MESRVYTPAQVGSVVRQIAEMLRQGNVSLELLEGEAWKIETGSK